MLTEFGINKRLMMILNTLHIIDRTCLIFRASPVVSAAVPVSSPAAAPVRIGTIPARAMVPIAAVSQVRALVALTNKTLAIDFIPSSVSPEL